MNVTSRDTSSYDNQDCYFETNSQSTQRAGYLKIIRPTTKQEEFVYVNDTDDTDNVS